MFHVIHPHQFLKEKTLQCVCSSQLFIRAIICFYISVRLRQKYADDGWHLSLQNFMIMIGAVAAGCLLVASSVDLHLSRVSVCL